MNYSLGNIISNGGVLSRLDPDAAAYISVLEAQGINPTFAQRTAINDFVNAEKIALRWSLHRRIYLPVWGNAGANAVDLVTRTSGSFVGGVTHANGFFQGNGTTGYMDFGASPSSLGITPSTGYFCSFQVQSTSQSGFVAHMGAGNTSRFALYRGAPTDIYIAHGGALGYSTTLSPHQGIIISNRFGGATRIAVRNSSGVSTILNQTVADAGTTVTSNIYGMAWNFRDTAGASPANFYDARIGLMACGLGMSIADSQAFTANLLALWESIVFDGFDADAVAYIRATGASDYTAINAWVVGLKNLGIWNNIVSWPMRSTQNHGTGTVLRSLGGLGQFNGTLTNGPSWTPTGISFDGLNNFVEVPNPQQSTALSAFSIFSVFDSDQTNGRLVFGSYNLTGSSIGPTMWAGNSPLLGGLTTDLRIDLTVSGATTIGNGLLNGNTGNWQTGFVGWGGSEVGISANGGARNTISRTPSTIWNNNSTWRMGARIANASFFVGQQALNLYANIYLTPAQNVALRNLYVSTLGQGLGLP